MKLPGSIRKLHGGCGTKGSEVPLLIGADRKNQSSRNHVSEALNYRGRLEGILGRSEGIAKQRDQCKPSALKLRATAQALVEASSRLWEVAQ